MLISLQRYPDQSKLAASSEDAITTGADKDAKIYYHRVGTNQCTFFSSIAISGCVSPAFRAANPCSSAIFLALFRSVRTLVLPA